MDDFTQLASVRAMIDRARERLSADDLPYLVMSDPGSGGYVAAYERVLAGGVPALLDDDDDGRRLLESFDITENLLLSHSDASRSPRHRWFSILTACIELLGWDGWGGPRETSPAQSLCDLASDSFALQADNDPRAPLDLLSLLTRELQQSCNNRHQYAVALLAELLVANLSDAEVEAKCRELHQCHDEFQAWSDEKGEPNSWAAAGPEFIWGAVIGTRKELRRWLDLVKAHFPSSPELAKKTRERLLSDGAQWRRPSRRTSQFRR